WYSRVPSQSSPPNVKRPRPLREAALWLDFDSEQVGEERTQADINLQRTDQQRAGFQITQSFDIHRITIVAIQSIGGTAVRVRNNTVGQSVFVDERRIHERRNFEVRIDFAQRILSIRRNKFCAERAGHIFEGRSETGWYGK